eukprot:scaffold150051_cov17-Tisochrysis_lutea.AAC.1
MQSRAHLQVCMRRAPAARHWPIRPTLPLTGRTACHLTREGRNLVVTNTYACAERPRPGIGAAAPMEGGMVFNMKRQGAAARLQAVRPGPRAARLQQ